MTLFENVCLSKDGKKKIILKNLNLDSLKKIMYQNKYNTVILDYTNGRFLFYDCIENISNKYDLYDLDVLSKSDETFEMVMLLKCNENDIKSKIDIAESYRTNCLLSVISNRNEPAQEQQQNVPIQQKDISDFSNRPFSNINLFNIDEQQQLKKYAINYNKTILQCDDDDSDRPTFDDIVMLDDVTISFTDELEDDEDYENNVNQQEVTCDTNNENRINQSHSNNDLNITINNDVSENISTYFLSQSEKYIISTIMNLSNRFSTFETNINQRLNVMEKNVNERLNIMEKNFNERLYIMGQNVNKRLSSMENNINLIYERQSLQSLLTLLDSVYLISSDRLETRTFYSNESDLTFKFFRFVSKQLIKVYTDRWSSYNDIIKKISLKPKSIIINLLGFGRLEKSMFRNNKMCSIKSPTLLHVDNTINYRSSYVSQCSKNFGQPLTHVLVFEGTTSPVYFETELLTEFNSSSSLISSNKKILSMKSLLRKLLQLERIIFFLSFYYKIDLSQFFAGLVCFHFYHNSHIDTNLLLKTIMSSIFTEAIPLLNRLYLMDQFILTY